MSGRPYILSGHQGSIHQCHLTCPLERRGWLNEDSDRASQGDRSEAEGSKTQGPCSHLRAALEPV